MTIGTAGVLAPFLLGFDVLAPVTGAMLDDVPPRFGWAGRYLETLTQEEAGMLLHENLRIALLSEAITEVALSPALGRARAMTLARKAALLGVPAGVHVTIDLESPAAGSDVAGYVNAMALALRGAGYEAALYVGVPEPLSGAELYALATDRYWKGAGDVPTPPVGWCAVQLEPLETLMLAGVKVDVDASGLDRRGRALTVWSP